MGCDSRRWFPCPGHSLQHGTAAGEITLSTNVTGNFARHWVVSRASILEDFEPNRLSGHWILNFDRFFVCFPEYWSVITD
jgi:hypothetical protein